MDTITYFEIEYNPFSLDAFTSSNDGALNRLVLHQNVERVSEMNFDNKKFFVAYDLLDFDSYSIEWLRQQVKDETVPYVDSDDLFDFIYRLVKKLRLDDLTSHGLVRPSFCLVKSYTDLLKIFEEKERRGEL